MKRKENPGFTLIEILVVVVILGLLAALVVPQFTNNTKDAMQQAFIYDVKTFASAAEYYRAKTGEYLEDSSSGQCPSGWENYVDVARWESLTPLGGVWDFENNENGILSGFGVDFSNGEGSDRDDAYMREIDAKMDDGNLSSGQFRKIANGRYYYVIADL